MKGPSDGPRKRRRIEARSPPGSRTPSPKTPPASARKREEERDPPPLRLLRPGRRTRPARMAKVPNLRGYWRDAWKTRFGGTMYPSTGNNSPTSLIRAYARNRSGQVRSYREYGRFEEAHCSQAAHRADTGVGRRG